MIISIGTDLVEIDRLEKTIKARGEKFVTRIYTKGEIAYCSKRASGVNSFAARFGAKEAVMKALGTGWTRGVRWVDIEVIRPPKQAPTIQLHGRCAEIAKEKGIKRWHLSLTHTEKIAAATVVAEA